MNAPRKKPIRSRETKRLQFFATAAKGLEPVIADELRDLGANNVREARGGAWFEGPLSVAYRACLWLRAANRVLYPLSKFRAAHDAALYAGIKRMPWENDLSPDATLAVDFTGGTAGITHTGYGAQRVKDGVVDRLREKYGRRPSVDREQPDLRINCHLHRDIATVSLDLSGDSLHLRGYRQAGGGAPLKETLAAGLLLKCGWLKTARDGGSFVDPLCGSGTLVLEAALMAGDVAPGLQRTYWGFHGWLRHDPMLWENLVKEAHDRVRAGRGRQLVLRGYDRDPRAIQNARQNAHRAGFGERVKFTVAALEQNSLPEGMAAGLVVTNPPYGERLGSSADLALLYATLGHWLMQQCPGWRAAVLVADAGLGKQLGLRATKLNTFYNGALECKLLQFDIKPERYLQNPAPAGHESSSR